jgi:hypothetical protein
MSKPPFLRVVGKDAEPDDGAEMADVIAKAAVMMAEAVKAAGCFWLMTATDDVQIAYYGGEVESCALAEEVARDCKRSALGLEP